MSIASVKPFEGSGKHDYAIQDDIKKVAADVIYYRLRMIDKEAPHLIAMCNH